MKYRNVCFARFVLIFAISATGFALQENPASKDIFFDPESLVRGLYAAVTFSPETSADWDYVKKFFLPEAVFAMRKTPTSMVVIDVAGFVEWFVSDVEKYKMKERGFEETVQNLKLTVFGDMAHCFVVYKARFMTPTDTPGQIGLDSFGLMKKDGRWWIVSVTNDVVSPERPLPKELQ